MASVLKVDKLDPQSGTALEIGTSGDTVSIPSGATLDISASTLTPPATMPASSGANLTALAAGNISTGTLAVARGGSGRTVVTGNVLQVLTATDSTSRTTTSTSFVTGSNTLSIAITPASSSNKIFIQVASAGTNTVDGSTSHYTINRDSTDLGNSSEGLTGLARTGANTFPMSMSYLDSPSTTSEIIYQVYFRAGSNTAQLNTFSCKSTITAFEISG